MNITGLGARTQAIALPAAIHHHQPTRTATGDSVQLSPAALEALRQTPAQRPEGAERPAMTDDKAAAIGVDIQAQNPDLFKALDTDGTGTLTAAKLDAGKDKIDQAVQSGTLALPQKPPSDQAADGGTEAQTSPSGSSGKGSPSVRGGPGGGRPAGGAARSGSGSSDDATAQRIAALHLQGLSNAEIAAKLGKTEAEVQKALLKAS